MAVQGQAVNQAAVNSGYNIVQIGAAALAAAAIITADITYVHKSGSSTTSTATLESYVWQFHNVPFSASTKATLASNGVVQKWETANFLGQSYASAFTFALGANGIFNCAATIQPDITYKWRTSSYGAASASTNVDQIQSNRATAFPVGTATFYPEGMLKLSGETVYTHDGSAKPTILGEALFSDIQAILKPDGWYAPCTSTMSPTIRFERRVTSTSKASAKFFAGVKYNYYDIVPMPGTASIASSPVVTVDLASVMSANAQLTRSNGQNRQLLNTSLSAPAVFTAAPFAERFGTYPVFDSTASLVPDTFLVHAGVADVQVTGTVDPNPFQWHFHDDGASDMSAQATVLGIADIVKGSDAVTFVRPADFKEFTRPSETKDFIRVAT